MDDPNSQAMNHGLAMAIKSAEVSRVHRQMKQSLENHFPQLSAQNSAQSRSICSRRPSHGSSRSTEPDRVEGQLPEISSREALS